MLSYFYRKTFFLIGLTATTASPFTDKVQVTQTSIVTGFMETVPNRTLGVMR